MKIGMFSCTNHSSPHSTHHNHIHTNSGLGKMMADESIKYARYMMKKWDVGAANVGALASLFLTDRNEAKTLLEATIGLQHAMDYYVKLSTTSKKLVRAHKLMQIAMQRLKFEFYAILSNNLAISDDGVSQNVEDLKSVAQCMMACGYGKECVSVYRIVRKSIVDESVYNLGIERLSKGALKKMEWKILETRIKRWVGGVKIAVETLFYREKILCDAVFSWSRKVAEACFAAISKDAAADLFALAADVCKCKKVLSPEKIFRLLDLYEAISDLWPEIEYIFSEAVASEAAVARVKLGETIRSMVGQFEEAVRKDPSQPPRGGGIHPLTRYVMNFVVFLGDYGAALSNIFGAGVRRRLSWLIMVLLCKLDGKAAAYNDVALSYLYLANNFNYVVSKARSSKLGPLIGEDWMREHELKVRTYLANYERIGWSDVISAINKAALQLFYLSFKEACRKQRSWIIPDPKIREHVKISLAKTIVSAYQVLCNDSRMAVRYTPQDLHNYLSVLFTPRI